MSDTYVPALVICDVMAEIQALVEDHRATGKLSPTQLVTKIETLVSQRTLLRAMYTVGYFSANPQPMGALH